MTLEEDDEKPGPPVETVEPTKEVVTFAKAIYEKGV